MDIYGPQGYFGWKFMGLRSILPLVTLFGRMDGEVNAFHQIGLRSEVARRMWASGARSHGGRGPQERGRTADFELSLSLFFGPQGRGLLKKYI